MPIASDEGAVYVLEVAPGIARELAEHVPMLRGSYHWKE
jgi:hypothetical protein